MTSDQLNQLQEDRLRTLLQLEEKNAKTYETTIRRVAEEWDRDFGHCFPNLFQGPFCDDSSNDDSSTLE